MPVIRTPKVESGADDIGTFRAELLSDTGGLTQFGAFIETITPGSASSRPHWHAREDEMIHVLSGAPTLIEGGNKTRLAAGDTATFKAGVPVGHCLRNDSTAEVRYLVIGTRSSDDTVTYTDTGETVTIKDGAKIYRDAQGVVVKTTPYHGA